MSIRGEFGAGISALRIASAEPSSSNRVRRVKTLRTRIATMKTLMTMKTMRPRRMVGVVERTQLSDSRLEEFEDVPEHERSVVCQEYWWTVSE